ncbi:MAG: 4-demethylwyosine synthase TYW1 [Methanothrix soehngenii]|jgi:tRNA wybutosine-synthesizing protein 1|uniref:4-demethylwyosine synthase TYW1 n=1 Tax=Methanothrix soehngenii TaxID=2223 RepID=UPI002A2C0117|nr:4-demethylwyosine synthase TYW1 [Methanothrix soehngenii]MDD3973401.1 4-demethylwyosine synthase TYW1 [Methanothrix soehngenii]MDD4487482.1 4-demethylwyosine synthase TYW1 [Methanothrix soehngenii]MDD5734131.1 4-demethylwyosine synthase TYW1 [Methanothrix soehngenii]MDY0412954.1 4-demethylwyosine synthase TYW1 [Methanothrix soehngenii]
MQDTMAEKTLARQGYHLVGSGAVKPCLWLNRSMRGGDQCYKNHFYGIASHRCVQMTPTLECNHLCLHCWRPIDDPIPGKEPMEPAELLEGILRGQQRFISGYGGSSTTDPVRLVEAREPKHMAISLMGEPTLYPYLKEFIDLVSRRGMTSFLVSNATHPEVLAELRPTQLYLSLNAPDEERYRRICNPTKDLWPRILESLELLKEHRCRSVIRMTLVRGQNMVGLEDYARLIGDAEPDFVELKAYMHLGRSRTRLERTAMPQHSEILALADSLAGLLGYHLEADVPLSRVALLSRGRISRFIEMRDHK